MTHPNAKHVAAPSKRDLSNPFQNNRYTWSCSCGKYGRIRDLHGAENDRLKHLDEANRPGK